MFVLPCKFLMMCGLKLPTCYFYFSAFCFPPQKFISQKGCKNGSTEKPFHFSVIEHLPFGFQNSDNCGSLWFTPGWLERLTEFLECIRAK